ncbi:hypothetical protein HQO38_17570 [Rhodococcus fascians]|nr:hypothetical protein [Rhodococcus fascians]MBY4139217.1 hypothetical protein [Rhodococcus fascians]MBY4217684.1 hypothetical protein [Rhodococcus fascians]MBY4224578.1 hypothetical protein [Rhodococcus fascians]MBY4233728.1 hypothetical protein [Rhodococcus fascians]
MSGPVNKMAHAGWGVAGQLVHQLQRTLGSQGIHAGDPEPRSRWRSVTINKSPQEVMPDGRVPEPLAALGDRVEVQARKAPGDKGTELAARLRQPEPSGLGSIGARVSGDDPRQQIRAALRQAKQLIEVGEVLRVDPAPHGTRTETPTGKLVELTTRRAGGEGVL